MVNYGKVNIIGTQSPSSMAHTATAHTDLPSVSLSPDTTITGGALSDLTLRPPAAGATQGKAAHSLLAPIHHRTMGQFDVVRPSPDFWCEARARSANLTLLVGGQTYHHEFDGKIIDLTWFKGSKKVAVLTEKSLEVFQIPQSTQHSLDRIPYLSCTANSQTGIYMSHNTGTLYVIEKWPRDRDNFAHTTRLTLLLYGTSGYWTFIDDIRKYPSNVSALTSLSDPWRILILGNNEGNLNMFKVNRVGELHESAGTFPLFRGKIITAFGNYEDRVAVGCNDGTVSELKLSLKKRALHVAPIPRPDLDHGKRFRGRIKELRYDSSGALHIYS